MKISKYSCLKLFLYFALFEPSIAIAKEADEILGYWLTSQSIVLVEKCNDELCATIEHIFVDEGTNPESILDTNNKDKSQRERSIKGINLISGFKYVGGSKEYRGGKIYDPGRGRVFKSNIYLLDNKNLKVEGCLMRICGDEEWKPLIVTIDSDGSRNAVLKYEEN
jgi:uncharacterized protein (DUF2147 family)|tara:strand:+ start:2912 stop:3409 length:498 start_codon:yes stop_codon:yes gene_type:complete